MLTHPNNIPLRRPSLKRNHPPSSTSTSTSDIPTANPHPPKKPQPTSILLPPRAELAGGSGGGGGGGRRVHFSPVREKGMGAGAGVAAVPEMPVDFDVGDLYFGGELSPSLFGDADAAGDVAAGVSSGPGVGQPAGLGVLPGNPAPSPPQQQQRQRIRKPIPPWTQIPAWQVALLVGVLAVWGEFFDVVRDAEAVYAVMGGALVYWAALQDLWGDGDGNAVLLLGEGGSGEGVVIMM